MKWPCIQTIAHISAQIYNQELEKLPEFKGFTDMITSFEIYKGKRTGDEILDAENVTGVFKGE